MGNALILAVATIVVVIIADRYHKFRGCAFILLIASIVAMLFAGGLWR